MSLYQILNGPIVERCGLVLETGIRRGAFGPGAQLNTNFNFNTFFFGLFDFVGSHLISFLKTFVCFTSSPSKRKH